MLKQFRSPVSLLASFLSSSEECPELALVTGESGAGKTTWCLELVRQARHSGLAPVGLVSPGMYQAGIKVAIDLIELETGENRRLAMKKGDRTSSSSPGLATLAWNFDPAVLAWGNEVLDRLTLSSLVILDELGPLEILDHKGLTSGLRLIDQRQYQMACVVIRPRLLPAALERWPWGEALDISKDGMSSKPGEA